MRRLAACLAMVVLLAQAMAGGPVRTAAAAPTEKNCPAVGKKVPVILVHGWNSGKSVWQSGGFSPKLSGLSGVFVDDQFDYFEDNDQWVTKDTIGPALAQRVLDLAKCSTAQRGHGKVVLVGHSMGGLAIRCAANPKCGGVDGVADKIALVVTMGTPNLGSWLRGDKLASFAEQILLDELKAGCQGKVFNPAGALLGATSSLLPICPLIGQAVGPAGRAFTEGSKELLNLPWLPSGVPTLALAAHKRLTVSLFTKTYALSDNVGDMVVNQKSAEQDVREIGPLGGKAVIDCGTYDFTLAGMFSTCWHGSEVSNTEFQKHVFDEIEKVTRSFGLEADAAAGSEPMNLQQIAAGNYTSLVGTWTEAAHGDNHHDGTGPQWEFGGTDTLSIFGKRLVEKLAGVTLQGSTLTSGRSGGSTTSNAVSFQNKGKYLEASLVNQNVAINWALGFHPKGTVGLIHFPPNNGVTLSNSDDTIYIWTSNNGHIDVFTRAGAAKKASPPSNSGTATCLTPAGFTRVLATPGIKVTQVIYCGGGWAATGNSDCSHGGVCNAVDGVFHAVGNRWTVSTREAVCDYDHNGATSPIPSKYQWFCQGG
jgi:pimeloyl-ACP methyl ester carboxylesterase